VSAIECGLWPSILKKRVEITGELLLKKLKQEIRIKRKYFIIQHVTKISTNQARGNIINSMIQNIMFVKMNQIQNSHQ
jgi:hypothetical protein